MPTGEVDVAREPECQVLSRHILLRFAQSGIPRSLDTQNPSLMEAGQVGIGKGVFCESTSGLKARLHVV